MTSPLDASVLAALFDAISSSALVVLDENREVHLHNRAARDIAGQDIDAWLTTAQFHTPEGRVVLGGGAALLDQLAARASGQGLVVGWLDAQGSERFLDCTLHALPETRFSLLGLRDCTTEHLAQQANSEPSEPRTDSAHVRKIAHRLGNVLGIVQIAADRLSRAPLPENLGQTAQDLQDACDRGKILTRALADAQADASPVPKALDIVATTKATIALAQRVMPPSIRLNVDLPDTALYVICIKTELEGALLHLLTRARISILTTPSGEGDVHLHMSARMGSVVIEIADSGPALSQEVIQRSSDPYFDSERALGDDGMGLNHAHRFARNTGGALDLVSGKDSGTLVRLSLPRVSPPEDQVDVRSSVEGPPLAGYRVLLAENDDILRNLLSETLRQSGAHVADMQSGAELLATLEASPAPDVIILPARCTDGVSMDEISQIAATLDPVPRLILLSGSMDNVAPDSSAVILRKPVKSSTLENAIRLAPARPR